MTLLKMRMKKNLSKTNNSIDSIEINEMIKSDTSYTQMSIHEKFKYRSKLIKEKTYKNKNKILNILDNSKFTLL
jgi:hypothetical protein